VDPFRHGLVDVVGEPDANVAAVRRIAGEQVLDLAAEPSVRGALPVQESRSLLRCEVGGAMEEVPDAMKRWLAQSSPALREHSSRARALQGRP